MRHCRLMFIIEIIFNFDFTTCLLAEFLKIEYITLSFSIRSSIITSHIFVSKFNVNNYEFGLCSLDIQIIGTLLICIICDV